MSRLLDLSGCLLNIEKKLQQRLIVQQQESALLSAELNRFFTDMSALSSDLQNRESNWLITKIVVVQQERSCKFALVFPSAASQITGVVQIDFNILFPEKGNTILSNNYSAATAKWELLKQPSFTYCITEYIDDVLRSL